MKWTQHEYDTNLVYNELYCKPGWVEIVVNAADDAVATRVAAQIAAALNSHAKLVELAELVSRKALTIHQAQDFAREALAAAKPI